MSEKGATDDDELLRNISDIDDAILKTIPEEDRQAARAALSLLGTTVMNIQSIARSLENMAESITLIESRAR